jgi:hypothetical protein
MFSCRASGDLFVSEIKQINDCTSGTTSFPFREFSLLLVTFLSLFNLRNFVLDKTNNPRLEVYAA